MAVIRDFVETGGNPKKFRENQTLKLLSLGPQVRVLPGAPFFRVYVVETQVRKRSDYMGDNLGPNRFRVVATISVPSRYIPDRSA